ncbi:phage terminase large subunit family protein [Adhaeretor mobilis]|uniref:Terminase-like family protein n=1 Tax=Adhaeretor mobilis TaxID=1930276 RepID=A0A517N2Q4_9BACT|nr:hypothetical protein [Adhaeretor mobilis]QDT01278.1 Terminase-like family protein [Adhaeretor mobilis]
MTPENALCRGISRVSREQACDLAQSGLGTLEWGRRYLPTHFLRAPSKLHKWLGKELDRLRRERGGKLNVVGPRGAAKSTIGSLSFVLQAVLEDQEPYVWIVSDTKNQAQTHLENIKHELETNELLAADYPGAVGKGPRWRASAIELPNGSVIEAYGTGQRLRGRRRGSNRPTLIVCDDLQNDSHIASAAQRELSRHWFDGSLLKAGSKRTNLVNLATALHRDALAMQLLHTPGWKSSLFRAIETWPTNTDLWDKWEQLYCDRETPNAIDKARAFYERNRAKMDAGAVLLWPDEEDLYRLMRMRTEEGRTAFEREKQSSPIDPERCEWPESYFDEGEMWFRDWPADLQLKTMALDPSKGSDARHGDYSAFVMLGVDAKGILYIKANLDRRPTPEMVATGVKLHQQFQPAAFGVETNQFQELLAGEFIAEFRRRALPVCQPYAITNTTNKQVRIRRLGPYLSQRRLRFHAGSPSTRLLVDQLRDFPLGTYDDGPDALEMALRLAEQLHHGNGKGDGLGERLV